jgi:hypothetical protein
MNKILRLFVTLNIDRFAEASTAVVATVAVGSTQEYEIFIVRGIFSRRVPCR